MSHYQDVLADIGPLVLESNADSPTLENMTTYLNFFGKPDHLTPFIKEQYAFHEDSGHNTLSFALASYQGTLDQHIKDAVANKTLTADLVAQASQVSQSMVEVASEAYAYQLAEAGDPLLASTYLVNASKVCGGERGEQRYLYEDIINNRFPSNSL